MTTEFETYNGSSDCNFKLTPFQNLELAMQYALCRQLMCFSLFDFPSDGNTTWPTTRIFIISASPQIAESISCHRQTPAAVHIRTHRLYPGV